MGVMQVMLNHYPIISELMTMIYQSNNQHSLVGGIPTPVKYMSSSVGIMKFQTEWKNETCSKAPTG